jgi:hypothetical protein
VLSLSRERLLAPELMFEEGEEGEGEEGDDEEEGEDEDT